jgi:hypothetical protein
VERGLAFIAGGSLLALWAVFVAWRHLTQRVALGILVACGALVGSGALLVQDHASVGDWVVALAALGVLVPLHARVAFGRPGASANGEGWLPLTRLPRRKGREPMSEPAGPMPVATQARPRAEADASGSQPAKPSRFRRPGARRARVVVRKVGPWSVLKLSFLFYLCIVVVVLGASVILYQVMGAIGALDNVEDLITRLFYDKDHPFTIHGDWLFSRAVLIGIAMVVLWSLINVFVAFLYNLLSDVVGGVEVTLSERR